MGRIISLALIMIGLIACSQKNSTPLGVNSKNMTDFKVPDKVSAYHATQKKEKINEKIYKDKKIKKALDENERTKKLGKPEGLATQILNIL